MTKEEQKKIIETILEGESEEVEKEARKFFKKELKIRDFTPEEIIWEFEEIAGDPHKKIKKEFPLEKFKDFNEAQEWAVERYGRCLGKVEKWVVSYDPIKDKKIKAKEKEKGNDE